MQNKKDVEAMDKFFNRLIITRGGTILELRAGESAFYQIPSNGYVEGLSTLFPQKTIEKVEFKAEVMKTDLPFWALQDFMEEESIYRFYFKIKAASSSIGFNFPIKEFEIFHFVYDDGKRELTVQFKYRSRLDLKYRQNIDEELAQLLSKKEITIRSNQMFYVLVLRYEKENWKRVVKDLEELQVLAKPYIKVQSVEEQEILSK